MFEYGLVLNSECFKQSLAYLSIFPIIITATVKRVQNYVLEWVESTLTILIIMKCT